VVANKTFAAEYAEQVNTSGPQRLELTVIKVPELALLLTPEPSVQLKLAAEGPE
jgi:hypothetical protein